MPQRPRREFSPEQKAAAVRLVKEVGSLVQVSRDLDLNRHVLKRWVAQMSTPEKKKPARKSAAEKPAASKPTAIERDEMARLRRKIRTLEMERDFLKKAAAFFDKGPKHSSS
jgi:transposase